MENIIKRIKNHFTWTKWESQWSQIDRYENKMYELFKSTNNNGLNRYKKVLIISSSCHDSDISYKK